MLTPHAITSLVNGDKDIRPTLQILNIKEQSSRTTMTLSDGEHSIPSFIIASQNVEKFKGDGLVVNSIMKITDMNVSFVEGRKHPICMILNFEAVSTESKRIGNPTQNECKGAGAAASISHAPAQKAAEEDKKPKHESVSSPEANKKQNSITSPPPGGPLMSSPTTSPPKAAATTPLAMSQGKDNIILIADLNPYLGRWTIKGRVVSKKPPRSFQAKGGTKRVFDANVMDESCDIKVTFWDDQCDKYFDNLEVGKCYTFSKSRLMLANSKFNDTKCQYEMTAGTDIVIEQCHDSEAPAVRYHFTPIDKLEEFVNKSVDVIGIVQEVQTVTEITIKSGADQGKQKPKRNVSIADKSGRVVTMTLWDDHVRAVTEDDATKNSIIAVRAVRVSDYNGCSINTTRGSMVEVNPDRKEAHDLREWYVGREAAVPFQAVGGGGGGKGGAFGPAPRRALSDVAQHKLGLGDKPDVFSVRATVTFYRNKDKDGKEHVWQYPSNPENKKKVIESNGEWIDEVSGKTMSTIQRRYILGLSCCDHSGSNFLTAFDEHAKLLLGMSADELYELHFADDLAAQGIWKQGLFKTMIFKVRAKNEQYQNTDRVKLTVLECSPVNYKEEGSKLLEQIRRYGVGN